MSVVQTSLSHSKVYFSPHGGCTDAVVVALAGATGEVLVQAYAFTSQPIANALAVAQKRGAKVRAIFDKSNLGGGAALTGPDAEAIATAYEQAGFGDILFGIRATNPLIAPLMARGVECWVDAAHAIAHNKVIVIDRCLLITGSFNFTVAAENMNAENLLVIVDPALAGQYANNWLVHLAHSTPFPKA